MKHKIARAALAAAAAALVSATPAVAAPNNNTSEKLRGAVTADGMVRHLQALQAIADANGGNRFSGTPGYDGSVTYVQSQLEQAGYKTTTFEFEYFSYNEAAPTEFSQVSPTPTTYVRGTDFAALSYTGTGDVTAPIDRPNGDARGCYAADFAGFTAGSIALVQRGTPTGFPGGACTFRIKVDNAIAAGAAGVIVFNNAAGVIAGTLGSGALSTKPAIGITQALGQSLAEGTVVRIKTVSTGGSLPTRNVLAELPGRDPNKVVMAGAHLDSVFAGPGINDNGSGTAAVLETAIQMAKVKPRNTVRFAFWGAEESGLVGSTNYVNSLSQAERDKIIGYLNFDMVASPNFGRFVYDGDGSADAGASIPAGCATRCKAGSNVIESLFHGFFKEQGLPTAPTPFNGRSDYGRFIALDIPAGGLFTGAEGIKTPAQQGLFGGTSGIAYDPCYHQACDTIANIDRTALDQNGDAVAHVTLQLAQNSEVLDGSKGKGNFKSPATAESSGDTGTGAGDDDDHDHGDGGDPS